MRVSVIIPTYNRGDRIVSTLTAISHLQPPPDEVIIVIDGSIDNTAEVVQKFSDQLPLKIVEIPNGGRSVARNTGVANSTGELLVFFDDDMRPFSECLRDHLKHHEKHPGSLFVGAIREDEKLFTTDIQQYRLSLYERKGWVNQERVEPEPMHATNMYLAAANFSISRKSFDALGGFDERLRDIEDFDLGVRALNSRFEIYGSQHDAKAYHDDLITCRSYIRRQREYYTSRLKLQAIKPDLYSKHSQKNFIVSVSPVKKLVFSLFSFRILVNMIDSGMLKYLMPKKLRYRFYDLVIGGLSDIFPERKI